MKNYQVISLTDEVLYTGSKHDVKAFIRKNRLTRYHIKSTMDIVEKVMLIDSDEDNENFLAKAATKEGFFNRVFSVDD